jgi:hypothetical protein
MLMLVLDFGLGGERRPRSFIGRATPRMVKTGVASQ